MKGTNDLTEVLWKWIEYSPKFTSESCVLSLMGLAGVLRATSYNPEFAALPIKKGGQYSSSNETIVLQSKLVKCLADYIVVKTATNEDAYGVKGLTGGIDYDDEDDDDYNDFGSADDDSYGE